MSILVTGGAGFIGSNFILNWVENSREVVVNLDKLTYCGKVENLSHLNGNHQYVFIQGDIADFNVVRSIFEQYQPRAIVNFAAESHVDRSIQTPEGFMETNVMGTFRLLEATRQYWKELAEIPKNTFRFLHISTDEVFGSLAPHEPPFCETTAYAPNSPYSASKAASDHIVRAYHHTYGLPTLTTNCSNNYGPRQFAEKLIPLMIHNALEGRPLPVYGDGQNIRDWLYVVDHCHALMAVLDRGLPGETYNIGGLNEIKNIDLVHTLCDILDAKRPKKNGTSYRTQISFVTDRPGHDRRYAINAEKIREKLGWVPKYTFDVGLEATVDWYLGND